MNQRDPFAIYLAGFVVMGLTANVVGPALTTLASSADVGLAAVAALFPAQAFGYLTGALVGGRGFDRRGGHGLAAAAMALVALAAAALPFASGLGSLTALFALLGLGLGAFDVGGNTLLVWSREHGLGPRMNALHLAFGVGALMIPGLVNRSVAWFGDLSLAAFAAAAGAGAVVLALLRTSAPQPRLRVLGSGGTARTGLLAAVSVFFVLAVALEVGFAGWIHAYGEATGLGTNRAAALTTLFWAAFTAARVVAVGVAARAAPATMLLGSGMLTLGAALLLVAAPVGSVWLWIGTAALGAAIAPQFACALTFTEERSPLSGGATSLFLAASALGGIGFPWLIGQRFETSGAQALPLAVLAAAIVLLLWVLALAGFGGQPRDLGGAVQPTGAAR